MKYFHICLHLFSISCNFFILIFNFTDEPNVASFFWLANSPIISVYIFIIFYRIIMLF